MEFYYINVNMGNGYTRELEVKKSAFVEFIGFYENVLNYKVTRLDVTKKLVMYFTADMYLGRIQYIDED